MILAVISKEIYLVSDTFLSIPFVPSSTLLYKLNLYDSGAFTNIRNKSILFLCMHRNDDLPTRKHSHRVLWHFYLSVYGSLPNYFTLDLI